MLKSYCEAMREAGGRLNAKGWGWGLQDLGRQESRRRDVLDRGVAIYGLHCRVNMAKARS